MPVAASLGTSARQSPDAFFNDLHGAYRQAEEAGGGTVERFFRVGGHVLRLQFAGGSLVEPLSAAFAHLACEPVARPALSVRLFDSASTATPPPRAPWTPSDVREGGVVEAWSDARFHTVLQITVGLLTMLDRQRRLALCWVRRAEDLPMPERAAPLRRLVHGWMAEHGQLLVHGGAVGFADGGVLLAGQEGAGKSTSALACLLSPLLYASDDYCLLHMGPKLSVNSLYSTGKTHPSDLARLPFLAPMVTNRTALGGEKALYLLHRHVPHKITAGFPLRAVLMPRPTGGRETLLRPASSGAMLRALAPSTVLLLPQTAKQTLSDLADLARRVPLYELSLGTDPTGIPATIIDLLAGLGVGASKASSATPDVSIR